VFESAFIVSIVTATFLLGGLVKGVIGMGLPTLAMAVLGVVMLPVQAAALLVVPSLVTNVWQLFAGPRLAPVIRRFAGMMAGVCIGTFIGIELLTGGSTSLTTAALGGVLALYAGIGLGSFRLRVAPRAERWLSPLIGLATGVLTGATGVFVIPSVPYFAALELGKEELVQALGLSFTVSTLALGTGLAINGEFHASVAGASLLALIPAIGGMLLGQAVRNRLHPDAFRRWFFIGLFVLGAYMLSRALI
jgi:uncharacterized membrane protein YfcA